MRAPVDYPLHRSRARQLVAGLLLCLSSMQASAAMSIRPLADDAHGHHRGAAKKFVLNGHENSRLQFYTPTLQSRDIDTDNGRFQLRATGMDNYHVLVARAERKGVELSAIRYVYFNGKPSGRSPAQLTALEKSTLEIVPDPLPREHWHYRAGDTIAFVVRFRGRPHASIPVTLSTSHASVLEAVTDAQGRVFFTLPDDFPETRPGRNANAPAELLLHAKLSDRQQQFASWLSADYRASPEHWQDRTLGALVAGGGFVFGALITGLGFRRESTGGRA